MKLPKILHSYSASSDADFSLFGDEIVRGLKDNVLFPNVSPALEKFETALRAFQLSIPSPSDRSSTLVAVKNAAKEEAIRELTILSYFVSYEARLNLAALETTNFELADKPKSKGLVGLVKDLELKTNGIEGMVIVSCKTDKNATLYTARVSTDGENWLWVRPSNSRTVKIMNLPVGVRLYVQMQLENTHGASPWSQSKVGIILQSEAIASIHE